MILLTCTIIITQGHLGLVPQGGRLFTRYLPSFVGYARGDEAEAREAFVLRLRLDKPYGGFSVHLKVNIAFEAHYISLL